MASSQIGFLENFAKSIALVMLVLLALPFFGFITDNQKVLQISSSFPAITLATIAAFFFSAIAILCITYKQKPFALLSSAVVILISTFGYQYMPLSSAIGCTVSAVAVMLIAISRYYLIALTLGAIACAIGILALIGLYAGIVPAYTWSSGFGMSLYGAIFTIALAAAILSLAKVPTLPKHPIDTILPASIVLYAVTIGLYFTQLLQKEVQLHEDMKVAMSWVEKDLQGDYERLRENLIRMASTFEMSQSNARQHAALALDEQRGFQAIGYVLPQQKIEWNVWANRQIYDDAVQKIINSKKEKLGAQDPIGFTARFQVPNQSGLIYFEPLIEQTKHTGWLFAYVTDLQLFHNVLQDLRMAGYDAEVYQTDNSPLFEGFKQATSKEYHYEAPVTLLDTSWRVILIPSPELLSRILTNIPEIVLFFGLALSTLALMILYHGCRLKENQSRAASVDRRLDNLIQASLDAIITIDLRGNIVGWNGGAEQIFGYSKDEVLSKPLNMIMPLNCHEVCTKGVKPKVLELNATRKNGLSFPVEVSLSRYQLDPEELYTATVRDVTERKLIEESLRESKEKAETANRTKSVFLSSMSHEMRTPLTSILGYSELLLSPETSRDQYANFAHIIQNNGKYLLSLISDILDITEIESNTIRINQTDCSVRDVVKEVSDTMRQFAEAKKLYLNVQIDDQIPEKIKSDSKRLAQILYKLLSNAIKYTEKGGITFSISPVDSAIQFSITDTGVGIPKEMAANLFQPFIQGQRESSDGHKIGAGIGLAIAKKLTELLGGKITYTSAPGFGTTFMVSLATGSTQTQVVAPQIALKEPVKAQSAPLANKQILIAEDTEDIQALIKLYLKHAGADIEAVNNGAQAFEKVSNAMKNGKPYDIVLMDIEMPEMTGTEATKKLRAMGYQAAIIALTAYGTTEEADKCLKAGFNEVLIKPIQRDVLIEKLANFKLATSSI